MGLQKFSGILLVLLYILCGACKNEEISRIYSLTFEKGAYEVRSGMTLSIPFRSGNKDYIITSSDTAVVKALANITVSNIGFGTLYLSGNAKGEATVSVKDKVCGEQVDLRITVTDFYLGFEVMETDSVIFQKNDCLFFVKNETKDFLVFGKKNVTGELVLRFKGNYEFTLGNKPYVDIEYEKDGHPVKYVFDMTESSSEIFSILDHFYRLSMKKTKDIGIRNYYMNLKESSTGSKLVCLLREQYTISKE